jgi:hypothetical protein
MRSNQSMKTTNIVLLTRFVRKAESDHWSRQAPLGLKPTRPNTSSGSCTLKWGRKRRSARRNGLSPHAGIALTYRPSHTRYQFQTDRAMTVSIPYSKRIRAQGGIEPLGRQAPPGLKPGPNTSQDHAHRGVKKGGG